jgi:hypothetical protein
MWHDIARTVFYNATPARYANEPGALSMNVLGEPAGVLMVLVVVSFLFLLCLSKSSLSEREQTVVWFLFTVLFFSLCSLLVRSDKQRGKVNPAEMPLPSLIQNEPLPKVDLLIMVRWHQPELPCEWGFMLMSCSSPDHDPLAAPTVRASWVREVTCWRGHL